MLFGHYQIGPIMTIDAAFLRPLRDSRSLSGILFYVLASLPLLLMALLFIGIADARLAHAEEVACSGKNVLAELKTSSPDKYKALLDEAAKVPNGHGTFWKVEKAGLAPSYLLGTMHMTDPRVLAKPKGADEAFDQAGTVIIESTEILDQKKAAAALLMRPELTMFTDGSTITGLLGKDESARLEAGLKKRGIDLVLVNKMKPWMIASIVSLPACEMARKAEGAAFLDMQIAQDAVAKGKTLVGLETMAEQLQAMAELPVQFHLKALIETLDLGDRMEDITATMLDLYTEGDVGMIVPMLTAVTESKDGTMSDYAAFEQRIVTDRNHVMAERSKASFDKGGVFMAVGALHLPGKEGVVELLRQEGFTVTAVN